MSDGEVGLDICAIVWDFDGLVLDTETPEYRSWVEEYARWGCELPVERWLGCVGAEGVFDPYADLAGLLGRADDIERLRGEIGPRRRARYAELMRAQPLRPGVEHRLAEAVRLGLRCAIATNSPRRVVGDYLTGYGIAGQFDALCCGDEVARTKPAPDLYLVACAALGVSPNQAIALEDSPHGIWAARAAGLYCVAVPNDLTRLLSLAEADRQVASLDELSLADLLADLRLPAAWTIRRYRPADHDAVWDLHNLALHQVGAHGGNGEWDADLHYIMEAYVQNGGEFLVGALGDRIVAMGALKRIDERQAEIKRMRVHPDHQRQGWGQAILRRLERRARELGYCTLSLDTTTRQVGAQRFYTQNGYVEVGQTQYGPFEVLLYRKEL